MKVTFLSLIALAFLFGGEAWARQAIAGDPPKEGTPTKGNDDCGTVKDPRYLGGPSNRCLRRPPRPVIQDGKKSCQTVVSTIDPKNNRAARSFGGRVEDEAKCRAQCMSEVRLVCMIDVNRPNNFTASYQFDGGALKWCFPTLTPCASIH